MKYAKHEVKITKHRLTLAEKSKILSLLQVKLIVENIKKRFPQKQWIFSKSFWRTQKSFRRNIYSYIFIFLVYVIVKRMFQAILFKMYKAEIQFINPLFKIETHNVYKSWTARTNQFWVSSIGFHELASSFFLLFHFQKSY